MAKPKAKSKRQIIRDERRAKRRERSMAGQEASRARKRQKLEDDAAAEASGDFIPLDDTDYPAPQITPDTFSNGIPKREFYGMLTEEEQEYFRRADELLELNDFPTPEQRSYFLENVYKELEGKELKVACGQSCSRLMERLILLSTTRQKKRLFEAFAGHFVSLVTHRFASHCCEKLFLLSAPVVGREVAGLEKDEDTEEKEGEGTEKRPSMEELFLFTLDEMEPHLVALLSDRFASHAMRVLLVVLSGKPLDEVSTKSLLQSKKKEYITVSGAAPADQITGDRTVPESFTLAMQKIIQDVTAAMDSTALRILVTHKTGNPVLQLLLELEISNSKGKKTEETQPGETLLEKLLPGAPASLNDPESEACSFVSGMVYDQVGSRLIETLLVHAQGKIFKPIHASIFKPRIASFLRNDIACFPAMKVLERLNKEDLADAVDNILPTVSDLISKGRFNVLKVLFTRCEVRQIKNKAEALVKAICEAYGADVNALVPKLYFLDDDEKLTEGQKNDPQFQKKRSTLVNHGSMLVTTLLHSSGYPAKAAQDSLTSLTPAQLLKLATTSNHSSEILITALTTPPKSPVFHKALVAALSPHAADLASSKYGHNVLNTISEMATKGEGAVIPFHMKEGILTRLAAHEGDLREEWTGRSVWRAWKGDLWQHRRAEWVAWAKGGRQ